jgi:hypothetical protein
LGFNKKPGTGGLSSECNKKKNGKQKGLSKDDLRVFETDFRQFISKNYGVLLPKLF